MPKIPTDLFARAEEWGEKLREYFQDHEQLYTISIQKIKINTNFTLY
jgi:hypothetical protein